MASGDLGSCLGSGRKDEGFLLALSSLLEEKEVWEQGSLDCPLQGFVGTYLSITHRGGASCPLGVSAWHLGQGVPKVDMDTEKSLGSMVTSSAGRAQARQKSNTSCHGGWLH